MKILVILLFLLLSIHADEMKRIEAIVTDITKLRSEYESCETELKVFKMQLKDQREENRILHQELNSFNDFYKREIDYKDKIENLESKIKKQEILLKSKENRKKNKIANKSKNTKTKEKTLENLVLTKCEEPNPFPKLVMKQESKVLKKKATKSLEKIEKFKASAFRLNKNAVIYNGVNGKAVEEWSEGTSFTSSIKTQNWVKITGYFVQKIWMRSSKEIWVKSSDVIKR